VEALVAGTSVAVVRCLDSRHASEPILWVFADENRHRTVRHWFWLGSNHPCIRISVEITNREMFLARKRGKVRRCWMQEENPPDELEKWESVANWDDGTGEESGYGTSQQ
jgi:hypothetical protein